MPNSYTVELGLGIVLNISERQEIRKFIFNLMIRFI